MSLAVGPVLAPASRAKNGTSQATALRTGAELIGEDLFTRHGLMVSLMQTRNLQNPLRL